jgi:hypothetical protein
MNRAKRAQAFRGLLSEMELWQKQQEEQEELLWHIEGRLVDLGFLRESDDLQPEALISVREKVRVALAQLEQKQHQSTSRRRASELESGRRSLEAGSGERDAPCQQEATDRHESSCTLRQRTGPGEHGMG